MSNTAVHQPPARGIGSRVGSGAMSFAGYLLRGGMSLLVALAFYLYFMEGLGATMPETPESASKLMASVGIAAIIYLAVQTTSVVTMTGISLLRPVIDWFTSALAGIVLLLVAFQWYSNLLELNVFQQWAFWLSVPVVIFDVGVLFVVMIRIKELTSQMKAES